MATTTSSVRSVVHRFRERTAQQPGRVALRYRRADEWGEITWGDYGTMVEEAAAGLIARGVQPGDRVGLLSTNRPQWHVADLASLSAGAVTVPVYPTSSSSQVAYVLDDAQVGICFVENSSQLAKVLLHNEELDALRGVVALEVVTGLDRDTLLTDLDRLRSEGRALLDEQPDVVADRVAGLATNDVATLVYTSGTTGRPKGAAITHGNIAWTIDAVDSMVGLGPDDRFLSYLPLSHIAERVTSHFGHISSGGETWFARSLATLPEDLKACRPTVFFAVPRVWQKFHDAILDQFAQKPRPMQAAFDRTLKSGLEVVTAREGGRRLARWQRLAHAAADRSIGAGIRRGLGLDAARFIVSSAAPIHPDLVRWFHALGLPIAEVWGQTEDCGPATMNPPDDIRIGTIGRAIPGLEIRTAPDGELQVRGGSVCAGYHGRPDATAELIDPDGWMATGDLGSIDGDGYVTITGRSKDLIINAAGKNISPSEIESLLSMEPLIGHAVVVGDGRRYLVALLTLDPDGVADWAEARGTFADIASLVDDSAMQADVAAAVERVNQQHAPVEQIKHWRLLPEVLTVEGGELTPTMKVKRAAVVATNADLVEAMYAEGER